MTGWEIFSKVDAVKWNLNQAEDISPRVFRLLKGPSIAESNQRGKRNKNHTNPLIQLKKATPLFVIALVLACFALSPQAFAEPTLVPPSYSGCTSAIWVKVCCTTPRVTKIHVKYGSIGGDIVTSIACPTGCAGSFCGKVYVPLPNTLTADCYVGATKVGTATGTYRKSCSIVFWVIGGILFIAVPVLIWFFKKKLSANR